MSSVSTRRAAAAKQPVGQGGKRPAAVGVGRRAEVVGEQQQLAVARRRRRRGCRGEWRSAPPSHSASSSKPTRASARALSPRLAELVDESVVAAVRHPDLAGARLGDGGEKLRPVGMIGDDERQLDAALAHAAFDAHPAGRERRHRIGEAARPAVGKRRRRTQHERARQRVALGIRRRPDIAEVDARASHRARSGRRARHADRSARRSQRGAAA